MIFLEPFKFPILLEKLETVSFCIDWKLSHAE